VAEISESEIIKGCKKGKLNCQEMLYKRFYGYAMSVCLRYSYSRDEAVEILNDSFIKVFDNVKKFDDDLSFKPWLRRILINTSIDFYRKNKKQNQNQVLIDNLNIDYDVGVLEKLNIDDILKILNDLPDIYRLTFNLYEIEGYSHNEISKMLNVTESTSRSNLTRAKQMLRLSYQKHFEINYAQAI